MTLSSFPRIERREAVPAAGRDGMLLDPSGAHRPFCVRALLVLTDGAGHPGTGELPGGEAIRRTREDAATTSFSRRDP